MKTSQDYICQVLKAHRAMLNRYYGIAAVRTVNKKQTVNVFMTHRNMLLIAYAMIMKGEY